MAEKSMAPDQEDLTKVNFVNNQPPPPPYSSVPMQPGPSGVTYVAAPAVVVTPVSQVTMVGTMGYTSSSIVCRSCNMQIMTRTEAKPSMRTHCFAFIICLLFWPAVCVPYCIDSCQNIDHYCPNCNAYIGTSRS